MIGSVAISAVTAVTVAEIANGHDGTLYAGFVGFVTTAITLILSKLYHDRKYAKRNCVTGPDHGPYTVDLEKIK